MRPGSVVTPAQEARLRDFLARPSHPGHSLTLGELRGFIFTLAVAPDVVPPSEWLPAIFGGGLPDFGSDEEARDIMGALMALYNEVNAEARDPDAALPKGVELRAEPMANLEVDAPVSQWSRGFVKGHTWLEESWEGNLLDDDMEDELGAVLAVLSFFSSPGLAEQLMTEFTGHGQALDEFAPKMHRLFPGAVASYIDMGAAIWQALGEGQTELHRPAVAEPRIGRNDSCVCGSGKKYKKCCGAGMN